MTPLRLLQDILALLEEVVFIPVRSAQELFDTDRLFEILAFATSAAVGIFSGVYPARRAASLDPITALRHQ